MVFLKLGESQLDTWWIRKRDKLLELAEQYPNAYVYDLESIRSAATAMSSLRSVKRVLYAVKANFNPDVIKVLASVGIDFDCVSLGEIEHLNTVLPDLDKNRILFTPNFAPRDEYVWAIGRGITVTIDNLYPLQQWPELFANREIFIRIDPEQGDGHHEYVVTSGSGSKFGVPLNEVSELKRLATAAGAEVVGIHAHTGSGIVNPKNWQTVANILARVAKHFSGVKTLDLGGGIGVPERTADAPFNLQELDSLLTNFCSDYPQYDLWLEPGRYLVAVAGVLLTRVTQIKGKGADCYIGVNTGINSLIRPALYDAYHEIVNLSRMNEGASKSATVVGPICEAGDKLGINRLLPETQENDVFLIANAGAYGHVMSSNYNLRDIPPEIVICD
ncbi:MAG: diaminopimelate decarboxylase [Woeseia sp.]|nr:diaminopimelate decarboxylase [Woeseia sp.]